MWIRLTDEVIKGLWDNWRDYYKKRQEAIEEVANAAFDYYEEYANDYFDDQSDYDDYLDEREDEISAWAQKCYRELDNEAEPFRQFLIKLSELKFYDTYVGYILNVDFYSMSWEYVKNTDPETKKKFIVHFETMHYWYQWEGVTKRTVNYVIVTPQFTPWQK